MAEAETTNEVEEAAVAIADGLAWLFRQLDHPDATESYKRGIKDGIAVLSVVRAKVLRIPTH